MTFKAYLMARKDRADAAGDFVRLARANSRLSDIHSAEELRKRLEDGGAPRSIFEAAQVVWTDYQRSAETA